LTKNLNEHSNGKSVGEETGLAQLEQNESLSLIVSIKTDTADSLKQTYDKVQNHQFTDGAALHVASQSVGGQVQPEVSSQTSGQVQDEVHDDEDMNVTNTASIHHEDESTNRAALQGASATIGHVQDGDDDDGEKNETDLRANIQQHETTFPFALQNSTQSVDQVQAKVVINDAISSTKSQSANRPALQVASQITQFVRVESQNLEERKYQTTDESENDEIKDSFSRINMLAQICEDSSRLVTFFC
jgi:hypothetical protein